VKLPALPKLSALSARERLLAAGVVFAVSVVLLDRVVLGPWWKHVQEVRQETVKLEGTIRTYQRMIDRKPQILAEVEAYSEYLSQAGGSADVATLLREIETLGRESGISLGEVRPLGGAEDALFRQQSFEVHYAGTLEQWVRFVHMLQGSRFLFRIERASLAAEERSAERLDGTLRLTQKVMK
jgi:Tfp pilus assembly protein PilO